MTDSLSYRIAEYENSESHNDALYRDFTTRAETDPLLWEHRRFIEKHSWGFGDRAFHYLWRLLLEDLGQASSSLHCLEIGVYKGQVLSLWGLIGSHLGLDLRITGISPFEGTEEKRPWLHHLRVRLDPRYRRMARELNLYPAGDYQEKVRDVFRVFDLDVTHLQLIKGLSSDARVRQEVAKKPFSLIYIDGDHSEVGVRADIRYYAPLLGPKGYLVMDDASCFLPGNAFWKGLPAVSIACEELPSLGFENVINIGHNRVYQKV